MKRWLFKLLSCILFMGLTGGVVMAGDEYELRHEKKVENYRSLWEKLIPQSGKMQFAGGMGLMSIGCSWDYGKKQQWETDLFLGYLPKFQGKHGHLTITLKENYIPWRIDLRNEKFQIEPFTASLYVNKIFGDDFWATEPDKYPSRYYNVATNLRFNVAIGQRFTYDLKYKSLVDKISIFYELTTNDLYVISWFTNRSLHLSDIFSLSLGLKFHIL